MKSVKISLSSIEAVRNFVEIVRKFNEEIDLSSGRYVVDAKSIMGIFSLDLSKPIEVLLLLPFIPMIAIRFSRLSRILSLNN